MVTHWRKLTQQRCACLAIQATTPPQTGLHTIIQPQLHVGTGNAVLDAESQIRRCQRSPTATMKECYICNSEILLQGSHYPLAEEFMAANQMVVLKPTCCLLKHTCCVLTIFLLFRTPLRLPTPVLPGVTVGSSLCCARCQQSGEHERHCARRKACSNEGLVGMTDRCCSLPQIVCDGFLHTMKLLVEAVSAENACSFETPCP